MTAFTNSLTEYFERLKNPPWWETEDWFLLEDDGRTPMRTPDDFFLPDGTVSPHWAETLHLNDEPSEPSEYDPLEPPF
jgi:hypothetical protein